MASINPMQRNNGFKGLFDQYYPVIILVFLFFFMLLPVLAPILMKHEIEVPAKVIYSLYSPLCHQYPYRSWFLFGFQSFYPLQAAGIIELETYEEAFVDQTIIGEGSRSIIGNPIVGYKMAFCQRDLAMYLGLFLYASIFYFSGRKIKRVHFFLWLIFGLIPLGLDGILQLLSELINPLAFVWESTPMLRTITGGLFGVLSGGIILPSMEQNVARNRKIDAGDF